MNMNFVFGVHYMFLLFALASLILRMQTISSNLEIVSDCIGATLLLDMTILVNSPLLELILVNTIQADSKAFIKQ